MKEFLNILELVKPSRFIRGTLTWSGLGCPMKDREKIVRAFMLKSVYNFPTTKMLVESLHGNSSLRLLCGWENSHQVPSEATFSRTFKIMSESKLISVMHGTVIKENYTDKTVGHSSSDSTEIAGREKACRIAVKKPKIKKSGCGYELHLSVGDGGIPLSSVLTSASLHDCQVAIPLMQMTSQRVTCFYDLFDSAYDARRIKEASEQMGHIPIIDPNPRRGEIIPLAPAKKIRFKERPMVERTNSDLKDNYGGRNIRVKGHWKVLCHLMLGILAITMKQIFNLIV